MRNQVIIPLAFFTYKFVYWFKSYRFLSSIYKISSFKELEEVLINSISKNGLAAAASSITEGELIFALYSRLNSTSPLLTNIIKDASSSNISSAIAATATASSSASDVISTAASNTIPIIISSTTTNNANSGVLAIQTTTSLIFECAHSSLATMSSVISQQYTSVPSFTLTDSLGETINVITDNVVFPLENSFSKFILQSPGDSLFTRFFEILLGKRKLLGQLIEERVLRPNINLYTVLSCKIGKIGNDIQWRLVNEPFQFSKDKLDFDLADSKFKTLMYGGFVIALSTSIILYFGIPMLRDYLYHLKIKQTSTTYEDSKRSCSICYEGVRDVVFLPCSHVVTCFDCSSMVGTCPVCRMMIQTKKKIFFS
ncbi:hypothetical protein DDB_G0268864 [Dictyostelium discoideum AX4]|uniref:RING-type domain-containing protein n=1 Tax=Dictyostelium discoideum TaxID=44689 RepID=Q55EJ5_DICDI|nr:hypothetical protein DDB_G0268864 [Dictyostelium discoideum AX4]EAL73021.1 hypothetical protein DDB_G0268864 [Dictyostelium discoideum AX4]|eukprot:XP_647025.1 hypothetical protein DDB_G0268864 [Dictyostelium discoideum AX4]